MRVQIKDVSAESIDDLLNICVPQSSISHANTLKEGSLKKKKWMEEALKTFGPCAKIAYVEREPVAFIEFYPIQMFPILRHMVGERKTVLITCVFVGGKRTKGLEREYQGRGIGSRLVQALAKDLEQRRIPFFGDEKAEEIAVGSWCSHTGFPEAIPRFRNFFFKNGFVEASDFADPTGKGGILIRRLSR